MDGAAVASELHDLERLRRRANDTSAHSLVVLVIISAPLKTMAGLMEPNQIAPTIVALKERSAALRRYL